MTKYLSKYAHGISRFNERIAQAVNWYVPVLMFILIYEGISRYFFNNPTPWSVELGIFIMMGSAMLGGAGILSLGGHVRMDAFYSRWSPRTRIIVDIATFCLFVYVFVMVVTCYQHTIEAVVTGQASRSYWGPKLGPIKAILATGAALMALQGIAVLIKDILALRGRTTE